MILVVGGIASDAEMADGVLDERPVVLNAQELVRDLGAYADGAAETGATEFGGKGELPSCLIDALSSKQAVACVEVGSGVVPLDLAERIWRERAGRLTNELAARADRVVRMICGIPVDLK